jgi:hypothetical protein
MDGSVIDVVIALCGKILPPLTKSSSAIPTSSPRTDIF